MIHERMLWIFRPVERSITVSAPQRMAQTSFSTSSAAPEVTAELPIFALILTRKFRPIAIGSSSVWLMFAGMMARPRATFLPHEFRRHEFRNGSAKALAIGHAFARAFECGLPREVLAMGTT